GLLRPGYRTANVLPARPAHSARRQAWCLKAKSGPAGKANPALAQTLKGKIVSFFTTSAFLLNEVNHEFPQSRLRQPGLSESAGRFRTHSHPAAYGWLCHHARIRQR